MTPAESVNAFGADVQAALVGARADGNIVFSPASIAVAVAMAAGGARGGTRAAIDAVLHFDRQQDLGELATALAARTQLAVANSLWAQRDIAFEQTFVDLLAGAYRSTLELVDYRGDPEEARRKINTWVSRHTAGRIPELISAGTLDRDSRLTLVNAVYLKAAWLNPFVKRSTRTAPFTTTVGDVVDVPTMHQTAELAYAARHGWQAVELPYESGQLAMTIVLAEGGEVPSIGEVVGALRYRRVALSLPRFDIETRTSMRSVLSQLGMVVAFTDDADFSGMSRTEPLKITDVVHQANITVDEAGTEAAAATAVVMTRMTAMPDVEEPIVVTVDRPFVFWLRDVGTGAVLFAGRVADPSLRR